MAQLFQQRLLLVSHHYQNLHSTGGRRKQCLSYDCKCNGCTTNHKTASPALSARSYDQYRVTLTQCCSVLFCCRPEYLFLRQTHWYVTLLVFLYVPIGKSKFIFNEFTPGPNEVHEREVKQIILYFPTLSNLSYLAGLQTPPSLHFV